MRPELVAVLVYVDKNVLAGIVDVLVNVDVYVSGIELVSEA